MKFLNLDVHKALARLEKRIMDSIEDLQATADATLMAVRAANDRSDRLIALIRDIQAQLAANGSDAAGRAAVMATLKQTLAEIDEQAAQDNEVIG